MLQELAAGGVFNYFGLEEWRHYFGKKVKLDAAPAIPWANDELRNPILKQKHFLFLGLDRLDGKPLDVLQWRRFYSDKKKHPKFYVDWYLKEPFAQKPLGLRWYWVTIQLVPDSKNLTYDQQAALLPPEYEMPSAIERVTANLLWYLLNDAYMDSERERTTVAEKSSEGRIVECAGFPIDGLALGSAFNQSTALRGIAASRRLPGA